MSWQGQEEIIPAGQKRTFRGDGKNLYLDWDGNYQIYIFVKLLESYT